MYIAIYQVNLDRDHNRIGFMGLDRLRQYQGSSEINSEIYDRVFEGEVDCSSLEDVYSMFNDDDRRPKDYKGKSMSVSDVVEIIGEDGTSTFHFCDDVGFQEVAFDPELAETFKEPAIKVILCEPGKLARVAEIRTDLNSLQGVVKGRIEEFGLSPKEHIVIICNEEGKLNGMSPNRAVYEDPEIIEIPYSEMVNKFREAERNGEGHLQGYVVFTQDSFTEPYSEEARTYVVSSNNKAFQPNMGGYSIYASSLDGSDPMVRLERYMRDEHGGENGWRIERCYMKNPEREMLDVIFGPFFICDCSGEDYGSLNQEQIDRFMKQFQYPERLIRLNGELKSIPYKPEPKQAER